MAGTVVYTRPRVRARGVQWVTVIFILLAQISCGRTVFPLPASCLRSAADTLDHQLRTVALPRPQLVVTHAAVFARLADALVHVCVACAAKPLAALLLVLRKHAFVLADTVGESLDARARELADRDRRVGVRLGAHRAISAGVARALVYVYATTRVLLHGREPHSLGPLHPRIRRHVVAGLVDEVERLFGVGNAVTLQVGPGCKRVTRSCGHACQQALAPAANFRVLPVNGAAADCEGLAFAPVLARSTNSAGRCEQATLDDAAHRQVAAVLCASRGAGEVPAGAKPRV